MNSRKKRATISTIQDSDGAIYTGPEHIEDILLPKHFSTNRYQAPAQSDLLHIPIIGKLNEEDASHIYKPIEISKIELSMKSYSPCKPPGLDGFNAHYFKVC